MVELTDALPTHPKTFGSELKKLRENAGVTIEDVVDETKVSRRILEALEGGKYQYLPERVFSRNFVRQYAQFVGCDATEVVHAFAATWETFLTNSGSYPRQITVDPPPKALIRWRFWIPVILAVFVVIIVATFMVRGSRLEDDLKPDPRRFNSTLPTPTIFTEQFSPTPILLDSTSDAAADEVMATVEITIAEDQECWIQYRDRDGKIDSQLLFGGTYLSIEVAAPALLSLGNAGAATIRVAGNDYEDIGRPGQVVHCEISATGLVKLGT